MKINVEVDVFEDYEFCNGSYHVPFPGTRKESLCRYWNNGFCYAFQEEIQLEAIEYLGHKRWMIKKCEPCKKAYKEAMI